MRTWDDVQRKYIQRKDSKILVLFTNEIGQPLKRIFAESENKKMLINSLRDIYTHNVNPWRSNANSADKCNQQPNGAAVFDDSHDGYPNDEINQSNEISNDQERDSGSDTDGSEESDDDSDDDGESMECSKRPEGGNRSKVAPSFHVFKEQYNANQMVCGDNANAFRAAVATVDKRTRMTQDPVHLMMRATLKLAMPYCGQFQKGLKEAFYYNQRRVLRNCHEMYHAVKQIFNSIWVGDLVPIDNADGESNLCNVYTENGIEQSDIESSLLEGIHSELSSMGKSVFYTKE
ncbi:hypothetical protein HDU77_008713 [Chytriomyces hyalinus]|nr:hypothetical protein HDU77_008713 [Chytriomyces hyalinus]